MYIIHSDFYGQYIVSFIAVFTSYPQNFSHVSTAIIQGGAKIVVPCREVVYLTLCSHIPCRAFAQTLNHGGKK
jgi:hypothetical protein